MVQKNIVLPVFMFGLFCLFCLFGSATALTQDTQEKFNAMPGQLSPQEYQLMLETFDKVAPRSPALSFLKSASIETGRVLASVVLGLAIELLTDKNNVVSQGLNYFLADAIGHQEGAASWDSMMKQQRADFPGVVTQEVVSFAAWSLLYSTASYAVLKILARLTERTDQDDVRRKLFLELVEKMRAQKQPQA